MGCGRQSRIPNHGHAVSVCRRISGRQLCATKHFVTLVPSRPGLTLPRIQIYLRRVETETQLGRKKKEGITEVKMQFCRKQHL